MAMQDASMNTRHSFTVHRPQTPVVIGFILVTIFLSLAPVQAQSGGEDLAVKLQGLMDEKPVKGAQFSIVLLHDLYTIFGKVKAE